MWICFIQLESGFIHHPQLLNSRIPDRCAVASWHFSFPFLGHGWWILISMRHMCRPDVDIRLASGCRAIGGVQYPNDQPWGGSALAGIHLHRSPLKHSCWWWPCYAWFSRCQQALPLIVSHSTECQVNPQGLCYLFCQGIIRPLYIWVHLDVWLVFITMTLESQFV